MKNGTTWTPSRFSDPSISSVIFAPRPENHTLSVVTGNVRLMDAIVCDAMMEPEEVHTRRIFENIRMAGPELRKLIAEFMGDYIQVALTTATLRLPSEETIARVEPAPGITPNYASHLDLLSSPTEGIFIDADDYVNR